MKVTKWAKFYKIKEDNSVEILRLLKIKNSDSFIMLDKDNKRIKLTEKELSEYIKLKPDGYINFSLVSLDKSFNDIIVSMFRRKDIEDGNVIPYCICRQSVYDLYTNNLKKDGDYEYIGCSVSVDTCPQNVDYKMMMACNDIIDKDTISFYIDDSLSDILYPVSLVNYNDILKHNFEISNTNPNVRGQCSSVKMLLEQNNFMYDVLRAFGIYKVPFKVNNLEDRNDILYRPQIEIIEDIIKADISNTLVIPFTKEIDLTKIERDHIIISDTSNKIYIVLYDKGESRTQIEIEKLKSLKSNS